MERSHLAATLSEQSLKRLSWFLKVPIGMELESYFLHTPVSRDEVDIITEFSQYTRALAGEDSEAPPDDAEDERRWKNLVTQHGNHNNGMQALSSAITGPPQSAPVTTTTTMTTTTAAGGERLVEADRVRQLPNPKRRKILQAGAVKEAAPTPAFAIVEEGRKVAAKLEDGWMMMTIIKFNKRTRMYTLEDADEQAESKDEHEVARDSVIPLASPEYTPPAFQPGTRVLAVYPKTTSFYPAVVTKTMKRAIASAKQNGKPVYDYMLQFDGDEEDEEGGLLIHKVKGDFVIEEVVA